MSVDETNISAILTANVDQLIADDFKPSGQFGGPREFTIVSVAVKERKAKQQSMTITIDGHLPFRPCLTMQRALAEAWGLNVRKWAGRRVRLYRDGTVPNPDGVKNAGGIRINGLTDIPEEGLTLLLTSTRGQKKPWHIEYLPPLKPVAPALPLADVLAPATIADLDRYRAAEATPKPPTTEADHPKIAAFLAGNPKALEKIRAWVAANPAAPAGEQGD